MKTLLTIDKNSKFTHKSTNLGCLKDGSQYFVADSEGNKISEPFKTADAVYDEIKRRYTQTEQRDKAYVEESSDSSNYAVYIVHYPNGKTFSTMQKTVAQREADNFNAEQRDTATQPQPISPMQIKQLEAIGYETIIASVNNAERLAETLKGVAWKIQVYGSHWEPSQAEREAIQDALAQWEEAQK